MMFFIHVFNSGCYWNEVTLAGCDNLFRCGCSHFVFSVNMQYSDILAGLYYRFMTSLLSITNSYWFAAW